MASNSVSRNDGYGTVTVIVDAWLESETNTTAVLCVRTRVHGHASYGPWGFGIVGQSGYDGNGANWAEAGRGWLNYGNVVVDGTCKWTVSKTTGGWTASCWAKAWGETVSGYGAYPSSFEVRCDVWVPAGVFEQVPYTPSSCTLTKNSDTSTTMAWNFTTDSTHPVTDQQRALQTNDGNWVYTSIANNSTKSAAITTTTNSKYYAAIRTHNNTGWSGWKYSNVVYTTPPAPVGYGIQTGTSISLNADGSAARYLSGYEWQYSADNGSTWTALTGTENSISHTTSAASPKYRVRVKNLGNLYSTWTVITPSKNRQIFVQIPDGKKIQAVYIWK